MRSQKGVEKGYVSRWWVILAVVGTFFGSSDVLAAFSKNRRDRNTIRPHFHWVVERTF